MQLEFLGVVECAQKEAVDEGWGRLVSTLQLTPAWASGLVGLDEFSHVWVLTYLHEAKFVPEKHLQRHPRGNTKLPRVGIFAQRARHRPNRIGITACSIVEVRPEKGQLLVQGLDAIDGTPILDIKPYVGIFDQREPAVLPDWMEQIMQGYFD